MSIDNKYYPISKHSKFQFLLKYYFNKKTGITRRLLKSQKTNNNSYIKYTKRSINKKRAILHALHVLAYQTKEFFF